MTMEEGLEKIVSSEAKGTTTNSSTADVDVVQKASCCLVESLDQEPVSVTRYNVGASHCFLYMTLTQVLLATVFTSHENLVIILNIAFHIGYTVLYLGFLAIYWYRSIPISFYTTGIALYTAGYATFEVYFWLSWFHCRQFTSAVAYICGSLLFLVGSVCLVRDTFQWSNFYQFWLHATAAGNGSMSFLLGSILFSIDSVFQLSSQPLVAAGLGIFAMGRVFFLYACTNQNCGVFFRPQQQHLPKSLPMQGKQESSLGTAQESV